MYGIIIAFKDFNVKAGILGSPWAGFKHFKRLFLDPEFFKIIRNTLLINLYQLLFAFPAPVVFAIMLNEIGSKRYRRFIQTATYLPHFISWVVMAGLLIYFLSPTNGIVNYVLKALTGKTIYFMSKKEYFRSIIVISGIWKEIGWNSIIYMAAIAAIDQSQYEAAICDGANRFQRMWHITIPSILPTVSVLLIMSLGSFLGSNFDQVFNLLNPVLYETGDVFDTYVYRVGLTQFQYSYTTAIGLFRSVVGMILIVIANFLSNKLSNGEVGMW
ncbi:MAG TPA: sugar ABC transporter permease [Clostridiales bacterium]|nr:sugar ABC transporter permease [Clostridiales bacterium]